MGHFTLGLDDIYACLGNMSKVRKNAICFSLFTETSIEQSIYIRWSDIDSVLPLKAVAILKQSEISTETDYIFWEEVDNKHVPLVTLRASFEINTMGIGWDKFRESYERSVAIDFESDYTEIKGSLFLPNDLK